MSFGNFDSVCREIALPLCPLVNSRHEPDCYARNIEIGPTFLFQAATAIVHIISVVMTIIMIYHIRSKYTAVGRKEMVIFFYLFLLATGVEFVLVLGLLQSGSLAYKIVVGVEVGLISSMLWALLMNGFVGFQWMDDGTPMSLWSIRLSSLIIFLITGFVATATFLDFIGLRSSNPIALFILFFIFNGAMLVIYIGLQVVLVLKTLDNRWPLGDIFFGVTFFVIGQLFWFFFSVEVCDSLDHYIDGMFFGTMFNLLSVMMVYKYWDSITKEDLEFSVGGKMNVWEVREPLMNTEDFSTQSAQKPSRSSQNLLPNQIPESQQFA